MPAIRRHQNLEPGKSRTVQFEGRAYGSGVSLFVVDADPGRGPALHVHPYPETWVVRSGEVEFTVGDEKISGGAGDIVVAPAHVPHRFENTGAGRLEIICIHPSQTFQQIFV
jgi:mannose-6-phosphate isomerase-like protein (cupin superfamily)